MMYLGLTYPDAVVIAVTVAVPLPEIVGVKTISAVVVINVTDGNFNRHVPPTTEKSATSVPVSGVVTPPTEYEKLE